MPAIALTDTNNMFGALEFSETMAKAGVQPIIGLTIAVSVSKTNKGALREPDGMLVLLATSKQGYLNLMQIASKVFLAVDTIQFICASLALGTFIVMLLCGYSLNTLARVLRSILLCGALGLLSYHLLILMPAMNLDLRTYWDAAEIGNTVLADTHKDNFLAMHSTASRTIGGITLAVLTTFFLGLWTAEHPKVSNAPEPA